MSVLENPCASLTQATYLRLREWVLSCRLHPGTRLNVKELAEQLDTNVGAVREALSRLTSEELVIAEPQKGFRVAPISTDDLKDLTEALIEIDGICLKRSIENGDAGWEADVMAAFHRLSKTLPPWESNQPTAADDWAKVHTAFHESLVGACDSQWLLRMRAMLFLQFTRYRTLSIGITAKTRDLETEHRALMDAVLARDTTRAVGILTAHIRQTTDALLEQLQK
jgi:DNA-binding GntR family transcriptional regulator